VDGLRAVELGTPGEMRQRLNGFVLAGRKRATAGLLDHDYVAEDEELEHVGERLALLDDHGGRVAELEVTEVAVVPFSAVTWEFADAEGEGFRSVEHWREAHQRFWRGEGLEVDDQTSVVCLSFRVV
jgi:uncharacterized protein YhfF